MMENKYTLTIFTPAYNRAHTIGRTYESLCRQTCKDFEWLIIDDGSTDGTREWVESLGEKITDKGVQYDWMGCPTGAADTNHFVIETKGDSEKINLEYVYKPNGGLYTGYNVAFQNIQTELCVCIDSDDYMPDNAVEIIISKWKSLSEGERKEVCGIVGLDYNVVDKKPIGGFFRTCNDIEWVYNLHHVGDTKNVFRTSLMRDVAPQIGFKGEKDFNPHYMQMQVYDKYPVVVVNDNLCWVEYQIGADSMSQAIFKQYMRSPKSFANYRIQEMKLKHNNGMLNKFRLAAHYVSACIFAKDRDWFRRTPCKLITVLSIPIGILLNLYVISKSRQ